MKTTGQQFNNLLSPNLKKKPTLQMTNKLPTLKLTAFPNRPVKGVTDLRLAKSPKKYA